MKKLFLFAALAAITLAGASCANTGNNGYDPVRAAAMRANMEAREFTVRFDRAIPNSAAIDRMPQLQRLFLLTRDYRITVSGDRIDSFLPFFGEAFTAIIGRQDGLIFEGPIINYRVSSGRRGATDVRFTTRTFEDTYDYLLTVWPNGRAFLTVRPNRKSSISFEGELEL
ncbi:MAG: DUF4251 domain-containing protein [Rikenellaceae bacterium]|nr:DUF4251 domain-containing protein [Rikenellaceae bacterium]MCL2692996.1 DUF4251 domain-containing protein [Rikenellaceae bacterium]